jgi:hypothetical protein
MKKTTSAIFLASAVIAGGTVAAKADVLVENFLLRDGVVSPSGGQISFTLNGDGSIAAHLTSLSGSIVGFGFNAPTQFIAEYGFSSPGFQLGQWGDRYGSQLSGIYDPHALVANSSNSVFDLTWTIGGASPPGGSGVPVTYASVLQAISGNTSTTDFFLYTVDEIGNNIRWGASAVPELSTWAMMLLGFTGLGFMAYRRKSAAIAA